MKLLHATIFRTIVRKRFTEQNCSIAQALEVLGDWWTLLIVREAFLGTRRFADFERHLGIAKNILSRRLAHLVEHGVLERVDVGEHGPRHEYRLSPMGKDLATVMSALRQWGDRWIYGPGNEPVLALDRRTGRAVPTVRILGDDGQPVPGRAIQLAPGPGASDATLERYRDHRAGADGQRAGADGPSAEFSRREPSLSGSVDRS
jgi:DNA-binding HxlR family transcriptional regulator